MFARLINACAKGLGLVLLVLPPGITLAAYQPALSSPQYVMQIRQSLLQQAADFPYIINSSREDSKLEADVYGVLALPFSTISPVLTDAKRWCEFIPLTLNVKSCVYHEVVGSLRLSFYAGRKFYESPDQAYLLQYDFNILELTDDYLRVELTAEDGPMGTSDYHLVLEAIANGEQTLFRFYTAYKIGWLGRVATRVYLMTLGADKEGFTRQGNGSEGQMEFVKGYRGVIERNTVRYVLALEVFLKSLTLPGQEQLASRIRMWFDATEVYARQLHELPWQEYHEAKLKEFENQQRLQDAIHQGKDIDTVKFLD